MKHNQLKKILKIHNPFTSIRLVDTESYFGTQFIIFTKEYLKEINLKNIMNQINSNRTTADVEMNTFIDSLNVGSMKPFPEELIIKYKNGKHIVKVGFRWYDFRYYNIDKDTIDLYTDGTTAVGITKGKELSRKNINFMFAGIKY